MEKETKRIGIIGAMDSEVELLKKEASISERQTIASMEFCLGRIEDKEVVIVKCGMGKVNAGICAATLIERFGCEKIINTGVAGSLDPRMDIGDIVISVDAVQHDFDVSPIGFQKGEIPYTGLYAFAADEGLRSAAKEAAKELPEDFLVYDGRICSGDQFITEIGQKERIVSSFRGSCCEMEGAAIAQTCHLFHKPFVILRAISDKPDGGGAMDFELFASIAARRVAGIVRLMLKRI